ncbi:MAG: hypothetical protein V1668_00040 [Patescibacteria group bacterium]
MAKKTKSDKKNSAVENEQTSPQADREAIRRILVSDESEENGSAAESATPDKDFAAMYQARGTARSEMFTIDRRDPNRRKKMIAMIVGGLVLIVGVTLAGFYYFVSRQPQFAGENISIITTAPPAVAAGADNTFSITVRNDELVEIKNVMVTVQFPDGFIYKSSSPPAENDAHNAWALDTIGNGKSRTVEIIGQPFGDIGTMQSFSILVSYTPANFNSEFQKDSSFNVTLNKSAINLNMEVPLKVVSGHAADYRIKFTNTSKDVFNRVRLAIAWPEDVVVGSLNPAPTDAGKRTWEIDQIAAGASYEVSFKGTVSGAEGAMREFKAEVGYTDAAGQYHKQAEGSSIVIVANPQLLLNLSINDSTTNTAVDFGSILDYTLKYRNDSQTEIKDMGLQIKADSSLIDWNKIINTNNGKVVGSTVTWDGDAVPALKSVKPGDEGEVKIRVSVKDAPQPKTTSDKNYAIVSQAKAVSTNVVDLAGGSLSIESNSLTTKINSKVSLRAEGRYYSDENVAVGAGPLPPQVGQKTTYVAYWYLTNNGNEVQNVTVTTVLPEWVAWENIIKVTAGTMSFDGTTRTVTWSINKLPAQIGQLIPELAAQFSISVTPTSADVGKLLILTGKSIGSGVDTFTSQTLSPSQDMITSDLAQDPQASGKGVVVDQFLTNTNTNVNVNSSGNQ